MCHRATTGMRCEATAVPAARHWATDQLTALFEAPGDAANDVALVVSELVSNCVGASGQHFELAIEAHHDRVRVEATDDAAGMPMPVVVGPDALSGRGLLIIDKLAAEWGVQRVSAGKTVWAVVPLPTHASPSFDCDRMSG